MKRMFPLVLLLCLAACNVSVSSEDSKAIILKTERDFSALSKAKGMRAAFLQYADSNAVLLRSNSYPIVGPRAIKTLQAINDSSFTLTWEPSYADISMSGDMGYAYGIYTQKTKDTTIQGTYVSVWKKQADGSWKFVIDTGNEGLGKKE